MIYLLYGSDTQRSREKLKEITGECRKRSEGVLDINQVDAEEESLGRLKEALESRSLFTPKKLVLVKYLSASVWDRREFLTALEHAKTSPEVVVVLWDRELSKKDVAEFNPYCQKVQEFKKREAEKPELAIFSLGDTFFISPREGLRRLTELLYHGHEEQNIFSYLVNHGRTLLTVKHYAEHKKTVPESHGIHPFVVKKAMSLTRFLPPGRMERALKLFFEEDRKIKTGLSRPKDSLLNILLNTKER